MGKGLSFLQEQILTLAWRRGGMIFVGDILSSLCTTAMVDDSQPFTRSNVREGYGGIHASLSRSLERLRLRGLTRTFKDVTGAAGTIISLTGPGRQIAEAEGEEGPE